MDRHINPVKRVRGILKVPGDKSISHRALLLGALAQGRTSIVNLSSGMDVASTLSCLSKLGVRLSSDADGRICYIEGCGGFRETEGVLDAGNSGTTIRLLSGLLAGQTFTSRITGDESLKRRPMERILVPLRKMGADIAAGLGDTVPLTIHGKPLHGIDYRIPMASAQIKSCVLLAGLLAEGRTQVSEPALSRDHTERMLPEFGVDVRRTDLTVELDGPARLNGCKIDVPGDLSSAAFFIVAASILPESEIVIENVGMNPSRTGIVDILKQSGGDIQIDCHRIQNGEPRADLAVRFGDMKGMDISGRWIPQLIDEIPVLAILATQSMGRTVVRNAKELRVKETDRIAAVADNLRAMGVKIDVADDGFVLEGPQELKGACIDSRGDHRIAMAFTIAGLIARGETTIRGSECVDISYPSFYSTIEELIHG